MKCDSCKHQIITNADSIKSVAEGHGEPYPTGFCERSHWSGFGDPNEPEDPTLWDDCKDFEPIEREKDNGIN